TLFAGTVVMKDPKSGKSVPVQLVSRTGASSNVDRLDSSGSNTGLLVQRQSITKLGSSKAIPVEIVGVDATIPITVDSVISDLSDGGYPAFWCSLRPLIYGSDSVNET